MNSSPTAPSGPPQRQSCDRCHKQKLRCIRSKNSEGGVCDRCLSKRAQCVYSLSLPKGRPSLHRLATESSAGDAGNTSSSSSKSHPPSLASEPARSSVVSFEADTATEMNVDTTHVVNAGTSDAQAVSEVMDTSTDMSIGAWPWLDTPSWDGMHLASDWSSLDPSQVNVVLASLDVFRGDGSAQAISDTASPPQPLGSTSPLLPPAHAHDEPGVEGDLNNNGHPSYLSLAKCNNYAGLIIAQLSQLSIRLSSLRCVGITLAQAAELSSSRLPNHRRIPLFQSAAFESVATWLAHEQCSAIMNAPPSLQVPTEIPNPCLSSGPAAKPSGSHSALRDVFTTSHRLLEILGHLKTKNAVESLGTTTASAQASGGSQKHGHSSIYIIHNLVMACDAQLLEIYTAVLTALQHDAYPGNPANNAMPLGDLRLVLVVQLFSYLVGRQQQAVDQCWFIQKPDLSTPGPARSDAADGEALSDLKHQVQERLAHLRQTLRCT